MTSAPPTLPEAETRIQSDTADRIRDLILSGAFDAGKRLPPERVLSKQLGVSRGGLREAISQLAALGIVHARQGAGTFVTSLNADSLFAPLDFALQVDPHSVLHLYELRRILEPVGAGLAATRITTALRDEIRGHMQEYDRIIEAEPVLDGNHVARLVEIDEAIHLAVATASGNPLLTAILRSLAGATHRARVLTSMVPTTPPAAHAELTALVDAIIARDPLRAEAAMLRHIARLEETARAVLRSTAGADGSV